MYEAFFGFSQRPFAAAPLAQRYFPAGSVDAARQTLARCIERSEGAGLLIGPPGTGKTLLLQVLASQFSDSLAVVSLTAGQLETRRELLQAVLFELKLPYRGMEEGELRLALVDHLTRGEKTPQALLLLVDEAHTLPVLLLEELRMMTNLTRGGEARVRLVLAGNLDLEELFAGPQLQAFSQRLAARCYLEPFDHHETGDYIRFQVAVAGAQAERVFETSAMDAVHKATDGIPRLVNQLCDHALMLAYSQERRPLDEKMIQTAWSNLQQLPAPFESATASSRGEASAEVVEFGPLPDDDGPAHFAAEAALGVGDSSIDSLLEEAVGGLAAVASPDADPENIELDFTAAFEAQHAAHGSPRSKLPALAPPRGLQVIQQDDNLQVVVDPYSLLDDGEDCEEEDDEPAAIEPPEVDQITKPREIVADRAVPKRQAVQSPLAKSPVKTPVQTSVKAPVKTPVKTPVQTPVKAPARRQEFLEEELVSDHYAELDARNPRGDTVPAEISVIGGHPLVHSPRVEPPAAKRATGQQDERLSLSEAMRRRVERETAAAMARTLIGKQTASKEPVDAKPAVELKAPASLPMKEQTEDSQADSFEERLARQLTDVLDAAQLDELRREVAAVVGEQKSGTREPESVRDEIIVIDDEGDDGIDIPRPQAHRVERQDYKSLFARLRKGP
jgi:type II secretory pathway predicted ATPase ExeA